MGGKLDGRGNYIPLAKLKTQKFCDGNNMSREDKMLLRTNFRFLGNTTLLHENAL